MEGTYHACWYLGGLRAGLCPDRGDQEDCQENEMHDVFWLVVINLNERVVRQF